LKTVDTLAIDLTAADVARAADAEADALRALGLGAGDTVAWLGLNGLRPLALLEACGRLGARYLPLNGRLAGMELGLIVQHADVQGLLHDEAHAELAAAVQAIAALPRARAEGHRPGDRLLVYTSGTTGQPKGAIHTAAGMAANIAAAIDAQGLDASTRALAVLPLFHVGGLCIQVLPTLAAGGVVRLHTRFDAGAWLHDVATWRPTTSLLVPAVMKALVEHPDWPQADLSSLAVVYAGSQVVPTSLIDAFHARGVPVAQVYGSTETGPVSVLLRPGEATAAVGSCGRPALGVRVKLAPGGELLLQAPNLLRAYHRIATPAVDADGWFHTGDLAEQDAEGRYRIVGRSKDLIISGGENIHPAEIENLLAQHPDIAECCVVGLPDARWGEVPVLVIVPHAGRTVDETLLRALFDVRLARFKHPRRIVVAASLPKTALGKVQRPKLAEQIDAAAPPAP
jgi:fatty-acyl-CoA synthase